jgi:chitodextrinase
MRNRLSFIAAILGAAFAASCTVHQTDTPGLTGPSTEAHSVTITLSPSTLSQDGASTSQVKVVSNGPNGPESQNVRLDMFVGGQLVDFGTLSARNITTGTNGIGTAIFTAPSAAPPPANQKINIVSIQASLTGSDAQSSVPVAAEMRLMPIGVILPPADTPTAQFTISPPATTVNVSSTFDASTSCPGAADASDNCVVNAISNPVITSYAWNFGDGTTASGKVVTHAFTITGTFTVVLTVTNDRGRLASKPQSVTIDLGTPRATFSAAATGGVHTMTFDASASTAVGAATIVTYQWSFGDGTFAGPSSSPTVTHPFPAAGPFTVTVTVTDSLGRSGISSTSVSVP